METNEENNTRYVPIKNYVLIVLMFIAVILITLYLFKWYHVKTSQTLFIRKHILLFHLLLI